MEKYKFITNRKENVIINPKEIPQNGIIFLLTMWSESRIYLEHLINTIEKIKNIQLTIFDTDSEEYKKIEKTYGLISHGKGEVLLLKDGLIVDLIKDYKNEKEKVSELINKLIGIIG